ncbi:hypothetical protein [Frankia sp. BMG5.23]|uniref:hypothetical protein n=1 Tax=Frankia sp. BMG5.23 TaxID=683305 RepID=UPI00046161F0|nr:hypothetical protein [Frankia sp. BMG5.23]KDA44964.1 hypothetical protein BMG523Draft_00089 [Frankia sp. BMG5.23]
MTPHPTLLALPALTLLSVTLGYSLLCWVRPFRPCRHCDGTGHTPPRRGRARSRPCRHCDHTGLKLRAGRHLTNALRRLR